MKIYDVVKDLLELHPILRDSDRLLIWNVWGRQGFMSYNEDNSTYMKREDFVKATSPESIRRCRQKIQELNPHLRSSKYVQIYKDKKADQKGTFIYREKV